MTDCNACLIGGEPDGICEVYSRYDVKKSRKPYKCCECGSDIPVGSPYEYTFTVYEGNADSYRTCIICVDIRGAYYCDPQSNPPMIEGLWIDIDEEGFWERFNIGCLNKLKTPAAKVFMVKKWQEWKGLA